MVKPCLQTESRVNFQQFFLPVFSTQLLYFLTRCIFHAPRATARWELTHNSTSCWDKMQEVTSRRPLPLLGKTARIQQRWDHGCEEINNQKSFNRHLPGTVCLRWPIYNWHDSLLIHMCAITYSEAFSNGSWRAMTPIYTNSRLHAELRVYLKKAIACAVNTYYSPCTRQCEPSIQTYFPA